MPGQTRAHARLSRKSVERTLDGATRFVTGLLLLAYDHNAPDDGRAGVKKGKAIKIIDLAVVYGVVYGFLEMMQATGRVFASRKLLSMLTT